MGEPRRERRLSAGWQRSHIEDGREFFFRTAEPGVIFWEAPDRAFDGDDHDGAQAVEESTDGMAAPAAAAFDSLPPTPTSVKNHHRTTDGPPGSPHTALTSMVDEPRTAEIGRPDSGQPGEFPVTLGVGTDTEDGAEEHISFAVSVPVEMSLGGGEVFAAEAHPVIAGSAAHFATASSVPKTVARRVAPSEDDDAARVVSVCHALPVIQVDASRCDDGAGDADGLEDIEHGVSTHTVNVNIAGAGFLPF